MSTLALADRLRPALASVYQWWTSPTEYDRRVQYFKARSMSGSLKVIVAMNLMLYVGLMVVLLLCPALNTTMTRVVGSVICVVSTTWAIVWWFMPIASHGWSRAFLVYCDVNIAVMAMLTPSFTAGVLIISFLILMSLYAVYWDGPRVLILHSIWITLTVVAFCAQRVLTTDVDPHFVLMLLLVAVGFVVSPPGFHFGIWVLLNAASESFADPLTGVFNRRGLRFGVERLWQESVAVGTDVVVMVVDLDEFKVVNDRWGHAIGDEVLTRSARRIEASVSDRALVARTGGEEFVVLDLASSDFAVALGERVRRSINMSTDRVPVTASVGVATAPHYMFTDSPSDSIAQLDELINRADAAMLSVKRSGRNRTVLFSAGGVGPTTSGDDVLAS